MKPYNLLLAVAFLLFTIGCTDPKAAKAFDVSSIITDDNVFHLLYVVDYKQLHHLTQTDTGWEKESYRINGTIEATFIRNNNICFSYWGTKNDGIACIENQTLVYINSNSEYWASDLLPSGELFHVSYDENGIRSYYLYDPYSEKKTLLFTRSNSNMPYDRFYLEEHIYPYMDQNNTWDGHTLISYTENYGNDKLPCSFLTIEENGTVENKDTVEFDASNITDINRLGGRTHYTQVKGKHYVTPRTGVVIDVVDGTTLQVASAADYFGDDNLKILQDIDAVDANGTFHHLRLIQELQHQELIYEKYIPSQTEPVYSEVIYKDKVEGEAW